MSYNIFDSVGRIMRQEGKREGRGEMVPGHEELRLDCGATDVLVNQETECVSIVRGGFIVSLRHGRERWQVRHYAVEMRGSVKVLLIQRGRMVYARDACEVDARPKARRKVLDLCLWAVTLRK